MSFNIANYGKKKSLKYPALPFVKMESVRDTPIEIVSVVMDDFTNDTDETVKAMWLHLKKADGEEVATFTTSKSLIDTMEDVLTSYKGVEIEKGCEYPLELGEKVMITLCKSKKGGRSYNAFVNATGSD